MASSPVKSINFAYYYVILGLILANVSLSYEAVSSNYANGTDAVESGFLFAKFASKLSALNFRISRRSSTAYNANGELIDNCGSALGQPLRGNVPVKLGPWPSPGATDRTASPGKARRSQVKPTTVTVKPSSLFNNSQFSNLLKSRCKSVQGFPDCYKNKNQGDAILREAVQDYAGFARQWLPDCNITRECAKVAERGKTESWFSSRWTRIQTNRSSSLPVCYELGDLKELSPERTDGWWFEFCCYTGAVCDPFSQSGWGKVFLFLFFYQSSFGK